MTIRRKKGRMVPPLSAKKIEQIAGRIRNVVADPDQKVDVIRFVELVLCPGMELEYEVVDDHELGGDEAQTFPDKGLMKITQKVYDGANRGDGRSIFTIAHEIAHFFLHKGTTSFARNNKGRDHKIYEDSEWQADEFASAFLMPFDEVFKCSSVEDLVERYGVSRTAAETRMRNVKRRQKK